MDSSLGLNIFTALFLSGTFLAALVAGLGGFAFGIVAAAVWLYILTPLQTATLIIGLGLVVQGYSVWKLRHALDWRRLAPLIVGAAVGVPIGVSILGHADPHYLRRGVAVVLVVFSLYGLMCGWTKDQQRAVFQPVGVATFAMSAAWLGGQGSITREVIWLIAVGFPVLLAGTWLGLKLYGRLDEAQFRKVVLILLLGSEINVSSVFPIPVEASAEIARRVANRLRSKS
jgi:uncharacterized membrane protein YfcA